MTTATTPSLFTKTKQPLADDVRPVSFEEVYGQEQILASSQLQDALKSGNLHNMILWGAPGTGKTTIARIIARQNKSQYHVESISAVVNNTQDIKQIFIQAIERKKLGIPTLLLVDEIHRFNKSIQDIFLPYMEDGTIILIGATTENPSFELNKALLSRCIVYTLNKLDEASLAKIVKRVEKIKGKQLPLDMDAKKMLCQMADGDGRYLLNMCDALLSYLGAEPLSAEKLTAYLAKKPMMYDRAGEEHYNLISALHKSVRGSDSSAALYYLYRMLNGGEDPHFILRRLVRMACEDIGLADPSALTQSLGAREAYDFLGSPEGELAIAQAVVYLATAPKSNSLYLAEKKAKQMAQDHGSAMPPKHILNSPTKMMKEQGYGKGYIYDHDTKAGFSGQNYFPDSIPSSETELYQPTSRGFENEISKRMEYWKKLKNNKALNN